MRILSAPHILLRCPEHCLVLSRESVSSVFGKLAGSRPGVRTGMTPAYEFQARYGFLFFGSFPTPGLVVIPCRAARKPNKHACGQPAIASSGRSNNFPVVKSIPVSTRAKDIHIYIYICVCCPNQKKHKTYSLLMEAKPKPARKKYITHPVLALGGLVLQAAELWAPGGHWGLGVRHGAVQPEIRRLWFAQPGLHDVSFQGK